MSSDPFDFSNHDIPSDRGTPVGPPAYMAGLNPVQKEAVEALDGPLLVLAGAGTGKTRVLTTRIAHLIGSGKAHPGEILAVTFTNKAAHEMTQRVAHMLGRPALGMLLGTFHSVSARWLREHAELVGLKSSYTILDTDDQIRLLKQLVKADGIDEKKWPARMLAGLIDRWKNKALLPAHIPGDEAFSYADGKAKTLYEQYQARLKVLNACDFGDLLLHMITIFQKHPDILARTQRRCRYLLVDEYQDTNVAQYLWLRLLAQRPAGEPRNICCVGDDDQSIYGWRGAEVGNILRFEADFPGARIVRLEQNYRSTGHILGAASSLIAANSGRLGKTLWTEEKGGEKVQVRGVWDANEEACLVGDLTEDFQRKGCNLSEIAILVRAGFQIREFEERMITLGIPYRVIGGPRFYERAEIRDALAYLRVLVQPDDDLAFERIINVPKRGLGTAAVQAIHRLARLEDIPMTRAAAMLVETEDLRPQARRSLGGLLDDFSRWRDELATLEHSALTKTILEESGYVEMWQKDTAPNAESKLENLQELVSAMADFENLPGFLEHISLVMENQDVSGNEKLSIMTLHAAKGLEFDTVFLPGWEEGVFPNQRALDEGGLQSLEEERRLGYVGLTRARVRAIILFAANRQIFGQWQSSLPSRFIEELDPEHIEMDSAQGVSQGTHGAGQGGWGGFQGYDVEPARGPGWDRARRHMAQAHASDEALDRASRIKHARRNRTGAPSGRRSPVLDDAPPRFSVDERVFHDKFGYGLVTEVDGNKLSVTFEHSGEKRVLDSFVRPA